MSSKSISVNRVAEILKKNQVDPKLLRQIVEDMNVITQAEAEEEKPPQEKKQLAILISDPNGDLPAGRDFTGWVLALPENESPATLQDRIFRSAYDYNASRKGRLYPAKTVGDALENVPAKYFKENGVVVKTKNPVIMLKTDNEVPKDESPRRERREEDAA